MAKIEKTAKGEFRTRVYLGRDENNKIISKVVTASDKRTLKRLEFECKEEYLESLNNKEKGQNQKSFDAAFEEYIERKEVGLSPATVSSYRSTQRAIKRVSPWFAGKNVFEMTENDFNLVIHDLLSSGITPNSLKTRVTQISCILRSCGHPINHERLPDISVNIEVPSENDIKKIVRASRNTELEVPILLAAFGPLRRGEICALQMGDIDGDTIHVRRNMVLKDGGGEYIIKNPKTPESKRVVQMPHIIIEKIKKQGYITKLNPDQITYWFEKLLSTYGIRKYRFHSLRHFAVSYYHAKGIPDKVIQKRGGWKTPNVMYSVYWASLTEEDEHFNNIISDNVKNLMP